MIISRTPFRISLFGGGTDYPEWYQKNKGKVISTLISLKKSNSLNRFSIKTMLNITANILKKDFKKTKVINFVYTCI